MTLLRAHTSKSYEQVFWYNQPVWSAYDFWNVPYTEVYTQYLSGWIESTAFSFGCWVDKDDDQVVFQSFQEY